MFILFLNFAEGLHKKESDKRKHRTRGGIGINYQKFDQRDVF